VAPPSDAKPAKTKGRAVPTTPDSPWQQRAVDRSINSARLRALARSSQFLAAAMELLEETGDIDFTVQSIVERSQLSLRAFYQHFGSKDELLLSLFEELVTQFTDELAAIVEGIDDPLDRLEAYVRGFLEQAHASLPFGGRAWTIYQMRLAADNPADYAKAIARQVEVLQSIVHHGVQKKVFRTDIPEMAITLLINSSLVSMAQMDVLDIKARGGPVGSETVWKWCRAAVTPDGSAPPAKRTRRKPS
jgi:AcrR family transcriptional regulator